MGLVFNGIYCETIHELEAQLGDLSEYQKQCARNDILGTSNKILLITPRQIRLQLLSVGITSEQVIAAIVATIPEPEQSVALLEWETAISFDRTSPFVEGVGALLGFDSEQLDMLWIEAAQL